MACTTFAATNHLCKTGEDIRLRPLHIALQSSKHTHPTPSPGISY